MFIKGFTYELVSAGQMPFQYNDLKRVLMSKDMVSAFLLFFAGYSGVSIVLGSFRWVYHNFSRLMVVFTTSLSCLLYVLIGYFLLIGSTHTFLKGIEIEPSSIHYFPHEQAGLVSELFGQYHISSSYGLFRQMTGVGGRPELVIKGSHDLKEWHDYEFYYKPQDLSLAPAFVMPH
mmetsp:Transcript_18590/g.17673  ORF Transcript_18590/g.17673 Transcript_18590/m.17673 type:complete len:175 (+) Transcript_18590:1052-1576(+)